MVSEGLDGHVCDQHVVMIVADSSAHGRRFKPFTITSHYIVKVTAESSDRYG